MRPDPPIPLQVWFAFSGNGSQWPKMGATLLDESPTFRASVQACAAVVRPLGIDLEGEFRAEAGWESPLMASLGLIAMQIGLVDVLREQYGIRPAGMLGHSAGVSSLIAKMAGRVKGGKEGYMQTCAFLNKRAGQCRGMEMQFFD